MIAPHICLVFGLGSRPLDLEIQDIAQVLKNHQVFNSKTTSFQNHVILANRVQNQRNL